MWLEKTCASQDFSTLRAFPCDQSQTQTVENRHQSPRESAADSCQGSFAREEGKKSDSFSGLYRSRYRCIANSSCNQLNISDWTSPHRLGCSPGREIPHQEPKGTQKGPWRSHLQRPVSLVWRPPHFLRDAWRKGVGEPSEQVVDTGNGLVDQRQKKGGRECRPWTRGRMRRRCWRSSDTTLFNQPAVPWASFTNCQKKGVFPKRPCVRRIALSPKRPSNDDVRFSDKSSPSRQNNGCGQQPKKKTGFPRRYG